MPSKEDNKSSPIPLIDISSSNPNAAYELLSAAKTHGFIFIENNESSGISPAEIEYMFHLSQLFFSSTVEIKQAVSISSNQAGKNHGWLSQGVEKLDPKNQRRPDVKEAFNIAEPVLDKPTGRLHFQQPLPHPLQSQERTILAFQAACLRLSHRLLALFAQALGLEESWFVARHDPLSGPSGSILRMLYYPKLDGDMEAKRHEDVRAGAHSDFGSLTLLFQRRGQPGLEILTTEGSWAAVPVDPRSSVSSSCSSSSHNDDASDGEVEQRPVPILVNIGDLLEDWTGGLLKSTIHRVVFPRGGEAGDRYSMAYFCHPNDDALLEAVPSEMVREHWAKFGKGNGRRGDGKVMTARDHLMERLAATYTVSSAERG